MSLRTVAFALAATLCATAAWAQDAAPACTTQGSPAAAETPLDPAHPSGLLMSIPIVTKLHGLTSATLAAYPANCDRGRFQVGRRTYALTGENADPNVPRRAAAGDRGAPIVFLAEAFDMGPSLAAPPEGGGEPRAVTDRWVLASALNDVMVVWRAYDAIPDDARLKTDMAAALAPDATPVMRFAMKGGAVQVLTP